MSRSSKICFFLNSFFCVNVLGSGCNTLPQQGPAEEEVQKLKLKELKKEKDGKLVYYNLNFLDKDKNQDIEINTKKIEYNDKESKFEEKDLQLTVSLSNKEIKESIKIMRVYKDIYIIFVIDSEDKNILYPFYKIKNNDAESTIDVFLDKKFILKLKDKEKPKDGKPEEEKPEDKIIDRNLYVEINLFKEHANEYYKVDGDTPLYFEDKNIFFKLTGIKNTEIIDQPLTFE